MALVNVWEHSDLDMKDETLLIGYDGCFRGQWYAAIIEFTTGYSLYTYKLCNDDILQLTQNMLDYTITTEFIELLNAYELNSNDWNHLICMFRSYGNRGAYLLSYY